MDKEFSLAKHTRNAREVIHTLHEAGPGKMDKKQ
jgi:hypothetical protein